ncbi:MAG: dTMP kinase [Thaumarchaeota archaeon]|nr:dTMP kinase [Nitrososphaerota archaeon]MCY3975959.1 dTMP kinase [Nitrososphaerota archaeon]
MIIVIEGCDQAGKFTQCKSLMMLLQKMNKKVKLMSFPDYSTPIGKQIKIYLHHEYKLHPKVIHCLLSANRWEKFTQIMEYSDTHAFLILNRYYQSNLAYGIANNLNLNWLENLDCGLPKPDLIILLDATPIELACRKKTNKDKFEKDTKFMTKVSETYKKLAKDQNWYIVNAAAHKNEVHESIVKILKAKNFL